jgi:hypothetical protein
MGVGGMKKADRESRLFIISHRALLPCNQLFRSYPPSLNPLPTPPGLHQLCLTFRSGRSEAGLVPGLLSQDDVDLEATLDVSFGSNMISIGQEIAATGKFHSIHPRSSCFGNEDADLVPVTFSIGLMDENRDPVRPDCHRSPSVGH